MKRILAGVLLLSLIAAPRLGVGRHFAPVAADDPSEALSYYDPGEEYLILVNRTHPLTDPAPPEDLTLLSGTRADGRPPQRMRRIAAEALEDMFEDLRAQDMLYGVSEDGLTFSVTSGYRSFDYQATLFETYVNQYMAGGMTRESAIRRVSRTTARPRESEHHTGLCVDMHDRLCATVEFESSAVFAWLQENAWRYGFILRYPKGKEHVTGYSYEPWHYRFVGQKHAKAIKEGGLTLEEYLSRA